MKVTKNNEIPNINEQIESMGIISNRDTFKILSVLAKCGSLSFSQLKTKLKLNPNSLSKHLRELIGHELIVNFYEKRGNRKNYSFYKITSKCYDTLLLNVGVPRIWELLRTFRNHCNSRGWRTSEKDDWIETEKGYHNFLWTKSIHPSSFKSVVLSGKSVVREDLSYRIVEPSHTAWLFLEAPPKELVSFLEELPEFTNRIAIYDLSQAFLADPNAVKFNKTNSEVFREFEDFLGTKWHIKLFDCSNMKELMRLCLLRKKSVKTLNHGD